jgi:hypothetical protein
LGESGSSPNVLKSGIFLCPLWSQHCTVGKLDVLLLNSVYECVRSGEYLCVCVCVGVCVVVCACMFVAVCVVVLGVCASVCV